MLFKVFEAQADKRKTGRAFIAAEAICFYDRFAPASNPAPGFC